MLRSSGVDEERKRHDKAVEQLQAAQANWSRRRIERLDWINEELRRQNHAVQTFRDAYAAIRLYAQVTGKTLDPLGPEPQLSDFYTPSVDLPHLGNGCDGLGGLQTRQVMRLLEVDWAVSYPLALRAHTTAQRVTGMALSHSKCL